MKEKGDYEVRLEAFEGPMDFLMHLIEKDKIDIYDIPIADLTQQYLAYLDTMRRFDLEVSSSFLVMAATLLAIKSRMMLPKVEKGEAEEEDPREELVRRILEYKKFREVSDVLEDMAQSSERYISRPPLDLPARHLAPSGLTVSQLVEAFHAAMAVKEEVSIPPALVTIDSYRIEDKMVEVVGLLRRKGNHVLFSEIFHHGSKNECIVSFLALLELLKLRTIDVVQRERFSEIHIMLREGETV